MSNLLEAVYQLDEKASRTGVLITRWSEILSVSDATVASPSVLSTACPGDKVRVVTDYNGLVVPGGAQTSSSYRIVIYGAQGDARYQRKLQYTATATIQPISGLGAFWLILPGDKVGIEATFSAFAVANVLNLNLIGYELPRGNIF